MNEIQYFKGWIPNFTKQLDKDGKVYTPEFVKHYKQKGRPAYLSKVLVLTKNNDVTLAIYGKYTSLSNPSFIACHNGGHIELDVKHWMDWFDDVGSMLHDDFYS